MTISPEDRVAILSLYAEYNWAIDSGDSAAWAATFVSEGVFHHPARAWEGNAELRHFVTERAAKMADGAIGDQRHWNASIVIDSDGHGATGGCELLVSGVDRSGGKRVVVAQGRYADRLTRTGDGWRFLARRLTVA